MANITSTPLPSAMTIPGGAGADPNSLWVAPATTQRVLTVGVGKDFATVSQAIGASQNGDLIKVDAGTYTNDFAKITTQVTIMGVGGMVNMVATVDTPNQKGIFVVDNSVEIDNVAFTGAHIADALGANGAGIRYEGGNMVLNNDVFTNNQDGILAFPVLGLPSNTITINRSTFDRNGNTSGPAAGYTHNVYVGAVQQLTVNNSVFEEANVGHELKSRAQATTITNSVFYDGPTGTASYDIDLPNGGKDIVTGNIIEKGPNAQNYSMVHFGGEGIPYAGSSLSITGNKFVNDGNPQVQGLLNQTTLSPSITGNTFVNIASTQLGSGLFTQSNNVDGNGVLLASSSSKQFAPGTNVNDYSGDSLAHAITLNQTSAAIGGGGLLTVNAQAGHVTVVGGTGGLIYADAPSVGGSYITTAAGSTNTLTVHGDTVDSEGTDTITVMDWNSNFLIAGHAVVNSGPGSDVYRVTGSALINAGGNETIDVEATGNVSLTGTETYASIAVNGGSFAMNVWESGTLEQATVSGGSAAMNTYSGGLSLQTAPGSIGANVRLGSGSAVITANGVDTIQAGSGNATVIATAAASITAGTGNLQVFAHGASGASVYGATGNILISGDTGDITYYGSHGANTVNAAVSHLTLIGGSGRMTVTNAALGQLSGGSGGMVETDNGACFITTQAGASDTLTGTGASQYLSAGNDLINLGSGNSTVLASGNSTINGSTGAAFYVLEGKETLNAKGFSRVTVTAGASATIVNSGTLAVIADNGGRVMFSETANADLETMTVTGSAGTMITSDSAAVKTTVDTAGNGTSSVVLGRGNEAVNSSGADTITGGSGPDTIALYHTGASVAGGSGAIFVGDYNDTSTVSVSGGAGRLTYNQGGSSAVIQGSSGTMSVNGGYGAVTVTASSGNVTLIGGQKGTTFVAGRGQAQVSLNSGGGSIQLGAGVTSVNEAGWGSAVNYHFLKGHGGGTDVIGSFRQGVDTLDFNGVSITKQSIASGSTTVTLSDSTKIIFVGQSLHL